MKKFVISIIAIATLALLSGCGQDQESPVIGASETLIETASETPVGLEIGSETESIDESADELTEPTEATEETEAPVATEEAPVATEGEVVFVMDGENYKFIMNGQEAPDLRVKEGETVRIEFTSTAGFHDWVVDEFDAKTDRAMTGSTVSVEFVADKKGTFQYYCSVGNHKDLGMIGNLIVE